MTSDSIFEGGVFLNLLNLKLFPDLVQIGVYQLLATRRGLCYCMFYAYFMQF